MKKPLLVVGSVAFDSISSRAGSRTEILGGAATYIALAASHFTPVNLVGVVGEGDFPVEHEHMLAAHQVDLTGLERVPGPTFRWSGSYAPDFSSRTTLDTQLGVFESFDPKIPPSYRDADILLLGNIHPSVQRQVQDAVRPESFVITDTMNLWINITRDELLKVIARTNLLVINDEESALLTGELQVAVAAKKILAMGPQWLIIKRGEHGAYLFSQSDIFFAPAIPLHEVIDPTGAGDSFVGGMAGFLASQDQITLDGIKKGMLFGSAVASGTCEAFGTEKTAVMSRGEIDDRYRLLRSLVQVAE